MGLIEMARELCKFAFWLRCQDDADFVFFRAVESETDHLPVGRFREGWAADSLALKDEEVRKVEEFYRKDAVEAATRLINRFKGKS